MLELITVRSFQDRQEILSSQESEGLKVTYVF